MPWHVKHPCNALLFMVFLGVGCGDSTSDGSTAQTIAEPAGCQSNADCDVDLNTRGQVCIDAQCRACRSDAACLRDMHYGAEALCLDDVCQTPCPEGSEGCLCEPDATCGIDLRCEDGTCAACPAGVDGCACHLNGECDVGLWCGGDACVPCPPGAEGCACEEEACAEGLECMDGLCIEPPCALGDAGCPCDTEACIDDLRCGEDGVCRPCTHDIAGCPCVDEVCLGDLICAAGMCRDDLRCFDAPCAVNQICEEREGSQRAVCLPECMPGSYWDDASRRCRLQTGTNCDPNSPDNVLSACLQLGRTCVEEGGRATCGTCQIGWSEVPGRASCEATSSCAALGCMQQHRACLPATADDPIRCGDCLIGYVEDGALCAPEMSVITNCDGDASGSLLAFCAEHNRLCRADPDGAWCDGCLPGHEETDERCQPILICDQAFCSGALNRSCVGSEDGACGLCEGGYLPEDPFDPQSRCRAPLTCAELNCDAFGTFCQENTPGLDAYCAARPCPEGQALRADTNTCVSCGILCGERGETGALWPYTVNRSNECICETQPGYYFDLSGNIAARPCDQDGDGWVRLGAQSALESFDPTLGPEQNALSFNARCDVREVDRFVLANEWGQELDLLTCRDGLVRRQVACDTTGSCDNGGVCVDGACVCPPDQLVPVALYESVRNDDQTRIDDDIDAPFYNAQLPTQDNVRGRRLNATEINPLTKACIATGDINGNAISDINEHYASISADESLAPSQRFFTKLSYFMELHTSRYERAPGNAFGRYVIQERSRCELGFPIQYEDSARDYWRSCTRNRDRLYDATLPAGGAPGLDFAQYHCDDAIGTCPLAPPPLARERSDFRNIPAHGLCNLSSSDGDAVQPPVDGIWRGMTHHSQFRCVQVTADVLETSGGEPTLDPEVPNAIPQNQLWNGFEGTYQAHTCQVACPEDDPACANDCTRDPFVELVDEDGLIGVFDVHETSVCASSSTLPVSLEEGFVNPHQPLIACAPTQATPDIGWVGWVAVRFKELRDRNDSVRYTRGCIDEWEPSRYKTEVDRWRGLCPGYLNPATGDVVGRNSVKGQGGTATFGRIICGCDENHGGAGCTLPCPEPAHGGGLLDFNPVTQFDTNECLTTGYCPVSESSPSGRLGAWMCGGITSMGTASPGSDDPLLFSSALQEQPNPSAIQGPALKGRVGPVIRSRICQGGCPTNTNISVLGPSLY